MNKVQWYEVFISNKEGTRTLSNFETLEEARQYKENFLKNDNRIDENFTGTLHIDKWEDTDNPQIIDTIE